MPERLAVLALRERAEQRRHVGAALQVGPAREVQAAHRSLSLARERLAQVLRCRFVGHLSAPLYGNPESPSMLLIS